MLLLLSVNIIPTSAYAEVSRTNITTNKTKEVPAEVKIMLDRLEEIKKMDKSSLNSAEKKSLRKEVRTIKSSLKASGNGVYFSVGAIIIIILLLILLLFFATFIASAIACADSRAGIIPSNLHRRRPAFNASSSVTLLKITLPISNKCA